MQTAFNMQNTRYGTCMNKTMDKSTRAALWALFCPLFTGGSKRASRPMVSACVLRLLPLTLTVPGQPGIGDVQWQRFWRGVRLSVQGL